MPRDTANETILPTQNKWDASKSHRLNITFKRITKRGKPEEGQSIGKVMEFVNESFNLCHPNDMDQEGKKFNVFRELGDMFRDNPEYIDVKYDVYEVAA